MLEPLPEQLVADLGRPEAHPDDPAASAGVETLQTHISHLFLTRDRVVKLRKAVKLPFLDFSTQALRIADCFHEVALNRRLAPDVYLGVAPVRRVAGHYEVREPYAAEPTTGKPGEKDECAVVMRRLEDGRDALTLLQNGELRGEDIDAVAATLARFHDQAGLGSPAPWEPAAWWEHCFRPVAATLESLEASQVDGVAGSELESLHAAIKQRFEELRAPLEIRRREGRAVDGHGDVHLQHVWLERASPVPILIDCIEFDPKLRRVDAANEVAFLAMDLSYRGRSDLAARFLRRYAAERDDFGSFEVVDAFQSYRAAVRAKVAALAAADSAVPAEQRRAAGESARRHLALAERAIRRDGRRALVLVCGTVGVGKSRVAEAIADHTEGVVISSDRTRKKLAGVAALHREGSAADEGMYTPEMTETVYEALLERAEPVVSSGRIAVLDATFGRRALRDRARSWAERRGLDALLVHVDCAEDEVRERVGRRAALGTDPSDAGPEFVSISRARFEAPTEWPENARLAVRTDGDRDDGFLERLTKRLDHLQ